MEYNRNEIQKFKIYANRTGSSISDLVLPVEYIHGGGQQPGSFNIPVFLTRETDHFEFIDSKKDNRIQTIDRQNFNPFFIEYNFFDGVRRVKINNGEDLSSQMIQQIRQEIFGGYQLLPTTHEISYFLNCFTENSFCQGYTEIHLANPTIDFNSINFVMLSGTPYDGIYKIYNRFSQGNLVHGILVEPIELNNAIQENPFDTYRIEHPAGYSNTLYALTTSVVLKSDYEIRQWYDYIGKNTNSWKKVNGGTLTIYDLETGNIYWSDITSKAEFYPIKIWR